MAQSSFWNETHESPAFAELCNALYERELSHLALNPCDNPVNLQRKLKSLSHYVKRTASSMLNQDSPISLDLQNASWAAKQVALCPIKDQQPDLISTWFIKNDINIGLVLPIYCNNGAVQSISLDSVDRVDKTSGRIRTNCYGWFDLNSMKDKSGYYQLLKSNKKTMIAACAGHRWRGSAKLMSEPLTLRELLLSCAINWKNLAKPLPLNQQQ